MSTELIIEEKEQPQLTMLPLCEANRQLVLDPTRYASNVTFTVGSLRLIDKAP